MLDRLLARLSLAQSGADLGVDWEKAQNDVAALRGQIEVLQHRLDALEKTTHDQQKSLEAANQWSRSRRRSRRPSYCGAVQPRPAALNFKASRRSRGKLFQDFLPASRRTS